MLYKATHVEVALLTHNLQKVDAHTRSGANNFKRIRTNNPALLNSFYGQASTFNHPYPAVW